MNTNQNSSARRTTTAEVRRNNRRKLGAGVAVGVVALFGTTVPWTSASAAISDLSFTNISLCESLNGSIVYKSVAVRTTNANSAEPIELIRTAYENGSMVGTLGFNVATQYETGYELGLGSTGRMTIKALDGTVLFDTGAFDPCGSSSEPEPEPEPTPAEPEPVEPTEPEPAEPTVPTDTESTVPAPVEVNSDAPETSNDLGVPVATVADVAPVVDTPSTPSALSTPSSAPITGDLPATGAGSWVLAALASALTILGGALLSVGRHRTTETLGG